jgi:Holliday junction resolvase
MNEMLVGQAGEYIAAAALLELGVQTMFSPTAGADLLAFSKKRYWRIEVKTTQQRERREGKNLYRWNTSTGSKNKSVLSENDSDIVGLVALDRRQVFFRPVNLITGKTTRLSINRFVENVEEETWKEAIAWS